MEDKGVAALGARERCSRRLSWCARSTASRWTARTSRFGDPGSHNDGDDGEGDARSERSSCPWLLLESHSLGFISRICTSHDILFSCFSLSGLFVMHACQMVQGALM